MIKKAVIILGLCVSCVSCSLEQALTDSRNAKQPNEKMTQDSTSNRHVLAQRILDARPDFQTAQISRAQIELSIGEKTLLSSANITLVRDSVLNLSVQPIPGIEAIRIVMSPTGLIVLDRMNKRYARYTNKEIRTEINNLWDFKIIEQLFMARIDAFAADSTKLQQRLTLLETQPDGFTLRYNEQAIQHKIAFEWDGHMKQVEMRTELPSLRVQIDYTDWMIYDLTPFPSQMKLQTQYDKLNIQATMSMPKIVFNTDIVAARYLQPSVLNYEKTELNQLLR